jgi:hypothetical protein
MKSIVREGGAPRCGLKGRRGNGNDAGRHGPDCREACASLIHEIDFLGAMKPLILNVHRRRRRGAFHAIFPRSGYSPEAAPTH